VGQPTAKIAHRQNNALNNNFQARARSKRSSSPEQYFEKDFTIWTNDWLKAWNIARTIP
jgi:hypothetical protein